MMQPAIPQSIVIMLLIMVSVALVAGITYVYTNRNKRVTVIFTLFSVLAVAFIKLIGIVQIELKTHFIGAYNENNVAYVVSQPGWLILFHAWHIWILPVIFVIILAAAIVFSLQYYKAPDAPKVQVLTQHPPIVQTSTRSERLSSFMAIDAAKKESQQTNERLAEALLMNASYEIKLSDINLKVRELERKLLETKNHLEEDITTLTLELDAKNKENEYILEQLSERSRELIRAQEMFEQLMEHQNLEK